MEKSLTVKSSTVERVLAATGILMITTGAFIVGRFNPATTGFFPVCPFHWLTGLNCPGCGLTRSFHALFHGDVSTALHFNALLPAYILLFLYLLILLGLILIRGRGLWFRAFSPGAIYGFLFLTLAFAVIRNLPFYPFNLLAI